MGKKMEMDQFVELISAVAHSLPRDLDAAVAQSWIINQDALVKALRGVLMPHEEKCLNTSVQPVAASVAVIQESFADLLAACKQDQVNLDFKEARFPLEPVAPDENDYEVVEHHFTNKVTIKEGLNLLAEMANSGEIRLLEGSRRAMKWVATHLDFQLNHPVILPLLGQNFDNEWIVPLFHRHWMYNGRMRALDLFSLSFAVNPDCGWLISRKRSWTAW